MSMLEATGGLPRLWRDRAKAALETAKTGEAEGHDMEWCRGFAEAHNMSADELRDALRADLLPRHAESTSV